MNEPIIKDHLGKKICKNIVSFCESWFIKHIVRPIFFLLPPSLLTMIAAKEGMQAEVVQYSGQLIGDFLNKSALIIIICTYIYVVLMKAVYAGVKSYAKPARELEIGDLFALLKAIDIVVGDKVKRVTLEVKKIINNSNVIGDLKFLQSTRPDQQIPLLIVGLRSVFEYMDKEKTVYRVGLLRIVNDKPVDWFSFDPASLPPRTEAQTLGAPTSTVSQCIKNKSLVVVEDIQKELKKRTKKERRYIKGNTQETDEGSQLCYPLIHPATGKVEYVFTVAGNRSCCLVEKYSELYAWIIRHFAVRVSLEHSLLIVKEKADESTKEAA